MSLLELDHVHVALSGKELLSDVSLELSPGEVVTLVGPNGAGKTTLLRTALGLLTPRVGEVRLGGRPVHAIPGKARASEVSWLPQTQSLSEPVTARHAVIAARFRFDEPRARSEKAALEALGRVGASELANARLTEISGGERQRVAIAALLAQEARLVLLDEPASHLDPAQQIEGLRLLATLLEAGRGVLLVTHDVNRLRLGPPDRNRVIGLARGRIAFSSRQDAPDLPERLGELFGVTFRELDDRGRRVLVAHEPEGPA